MEGVEFVFSRGAAGNACVSDYLGVAPPLEGRPDPAYVAKREVTAFGLTWHATYVSLFFDENPGYRVCGLAALGKHAGDVERIVVLSDYVTERPALVYFGAHGHGQGVWVDWAACDVRNGYLRVYVAAGSNGMYPRPGRYWRAFGLANDVCDGDGLSKTYLFDELTDASAMAWSDTHFQVAPGVNSPLNTPQPSQASITPRQRLLLPLYAAALRRQAAIRVGPHPPSADAARTTAASAAHIAAGGGDPPPLIGSHGASPCLATLRTANALNIASFS